MKSDLSNSAVLEHVNFTVSDPLKTAELLCGLFHWKIRWQGKSIHDGFSVHVGGEGSYLALYNSSRSKDTDASPYFSYGGLNHIAVAVEDLDATESRVVAAGFTPHNYAEYEPGRRFYFNDSDDIEYEIVSY